MGELRTPIAIAVCVAVIIAVGALSGHDPYQPHPHKPVASVPRELAEPNEAQTAPGEPAARQLARRFLTAFAVYETGATSRQVHDAIAQTTTPNLGVSLLNDPPRPVHGTHPALRATIAALTLSAASNESLQYLAEIHRGALTETFSLLLAPSPGGWRVTEVTQ